MSFGWRVELEGRLSLELGRVRSVPGEGVLGRYGHCGNNQRPSAEAADGTSRTRALAVSRSHRRGREWPTLPNPLLGSARTLKELISEILQNFKQVSKSLS